MTTKKTITIDPAKLQQAATAVEALVRTTPWAFGKVEVRDDGLASRVQVELALPGTNPMSITAEVAYGRDWRVEASGWSWKNGKADEVRTTAQVLQLAASIMTLLDTIA